MGGAAGAGLGVLALLGVLAGLSKEIQLVLLPLVYLARRHEGPGRGLAAALVAVPALTATVLMRVWWQPQMQATYPVPSFATLGVAVERLGERWRDTGILLAGVTPLALAGALRAKARPFLRTYGYLGLAFLLLPFVAWMYDARPGRVPFFGDTVHRLLAYALPVLLPLALLALDRVFPLVEPRASKAARPRKLANALAALALATSPLWGLDRYRRAEFRGSLSGPAVRAICRQSLKAAALLEQGRSVVLDPDALRFTEEDPRLSRTRWFLREGWGDFPYFETGEVLMQGRVASLLVPCFRPADLDLTITLSAPRDTPLHVELNGLPLGTLVVRPEAREQRLRLPASALIRGDNLLGLVATGDEPPRARFLRLVLEARSGAPLGREVSWAGGIEERASQDRIRPPGNNGPQAVVMQS